MRVIFIRYIREILREQREALASSSTDDDDTLDDAYADEYFVITSLTYRVIYSYPKHFPLEIEARIMVTRIE